MLKRCLDIIASLGGLIVLSPVMAVAAVAIRLGSEGSVYYRQERVGKNGALFNVLKFRTMKMDSDRGHVITVGERDPRITSVGYVLRRYKLDELPQLINVLRGEMSLVGPRPELKKFTDLYNEEQRKVLSVRPGITDPASIRFRKENELLQGKSDPIDYYISQILPEKLALNLRYLENRSMITDLKVILHTVFLIFRKD